MKRKQAEKYFNEIYNATFDEAVTYVSARTGNTGITPTVLEDTYKALFYYLLKLKEPDDSAVSEKFIEILKKITEEFKAPDAECDEYVSTKQEVEDIENSDIAMSEEQATDDLYVKKAHSYVLQRSSLERRVFILYFYENCTAERISALLSIPVENVYGYIKKTSEDIQANFLSKYISK